MVLKNTHRLHEHQVSDDESNDDFVLVSVDQADALYNGAFVPRKHLFFVDPSNSRLYRHLAVVDWWMSRWVSSVDTSAVSWCCTAPNLLTQSVSSWIPGGEVL